MPKPCNTQHIFLTHSRTSAEKEGERRLFTNSTRGLHQSRSRSPWIRGGATGRGEDFMKTRQSAEAWGVAPRGGNQRRQNLFRNRNSNPGWAPWARQNDDRRGGAKSDDDKKALTTMKTMNKGKGRTGGGKKGRGKGRGASKSEGRGEMDLDVELDKYFERKLDHKLDKQLDDYFAEKDMVISSKKSEHEEKPEEKAD